METKIIITEEHCKPKRLIVSHDLLTSTQVVNLLNHLTKYEVLSSEEKFPRFLEKKSIEEAIIYVKNLKFYTAERQKYLKTVYYWEDALTLTMPYIFYQDAFWHSDWGGTFFKWSLSDSLVELVFAEVKKRFKEANIDLNISSTENSLWYSHCYLEFERRGYDIVVRQRRSKEEWVYKDTVTEL